MKILCVLATAASLFSAAYGQDSLNIAKIGEYDYWDYPYQLLLQGTCLYAAAGSGGLKITYVSDWSNPARGNCCITPGTAVDLAQFSNYIYIADYNNGIAVVDIADTLQPVLVAQLDTALQCLSVAVQDSVLYACLEDEIRSYDLTDPASPALLDIYDTGINDPLRIYLYGGAAYAIMTYAGVTNLHILNIADPANITYSGTVTSSPGIRDLAISGVYGYMLLGSSVKSLYLSNPFAPSYLGTVNFIGEGKDIAVLESYAYVSASDEGLKIFYIANPANMSAAGSSSLPQFAASVAVNERAAYVGDKSFGLRIFDVRIASQPVQTASMQAAAKINAVKIAGDYAYLADEYTGLRILDISDINNPVETGILSNAGGGINGRGLDYQAGLVYLAGGNGGLRIIDVTFPAEPEEVGSITGVGVVNEVVVSGSYAYTGLYQSGIASISVANPTAPQILDTFGGGLSVCDLLKDGNLLYAACGINGVFVINIQNPVNLTEVMRFDTPDFAWGIGKIGGILYETDSNALQIYDVGQLTTPPPLLGSYAMPGGNCYDLEATGDIVTLACGNGNIRALNIAIPESITVAGYYPPTDYCQDLQADGQYLYAGSTSFFTIYDYSATGNTAVENQLKIKNYELKIISAYPNPFNQRLALEFTLPEAAEIKLAVYDALGREVQELGIGNWDLGKHTVVWDASGVGSGVYFVRLTVDSGQSSVRKVVLMK